MNLEHIMENIMFVLIFRHYYLSVLIFKVIGLIFLALDYIHIISQNPFRSSRLEFLPILSPSISFLNIEPFFKGKYFSPQVK
jgi:hypothetical protein